VTGEPLDTCALELGLRGGHSGALGSLRSRSAAAMMMDAEPSKNGAGESTDTGYIAPIYTLVNRVELWVGDDVIVLVGVNAMRTKFKILRIDRGSGLRMHVRTCA